VERQLGGGGARGEMSVEQQVSETEQLKTEPLLAGRLLLSPMM